MARSTGKKKTSKPPVENSPTTPIAASDTPDSARAPTATPSSTPLQENSAPSQASSHASKNDPKTRKSSQVRKPLAPLPDKEPAALLARIAEQEGE
jgi:hypothetical protein